MQDSDSRAVLLTCLMGLAGCGAPVDGYSGPRGTAAGNISVDGQPLPEGYQVVFIATHGNFVASGTIEQDGHYKLLYRVAEGLPVGDYGVQLGLPSDYGASIVVQGGGPQAMDFAAMTKAWKAAMPFPERYLSASTSGLRFTVQPGPNKADFSVTTAAKPVVSAAATGP